MRLTAVVVMLGAATSSTVTLAGCDDPEPPPPVTTSVRTSPAGSGAKKARPPGARDQRPQMAQAPMKQLRAELCFLGGFGAVYTLREYTTSLGGAKPGPGHVPSFGQHANQTMGRLPFERYLRACGAAARLAQGRWPGLDAALKEFSGVATTAARVLSHASRYYARSEHERDAFALGQESHQQIVDGFAEFESKHRAFGVALEKWRSDTLAKEAMPRDPVGLRALKVVDAAHALATAWFAEERDQAEEKTAVAALRSHVAELADTPRLTAVVREANALIALGEKLPKEALDAKHKYDVATRLAALLEADDRALRKGRQHPAKARTPTMLQPTGVQSSVPNDGDEAATER